MKAAFLVLLVASVSAQAGEVRLKCYQEYAKDLGKCNQEAQKALNQMGCKVLQWVPNKTANGTMLAITELCENVAIREVKAAGTDSGSYYNEVCGPGMNLTEWKVASIIPEPFSDKICTDPKSAAAAASGSGPRAGSAVHLMDSKASIEVYYPNVGSLRFDLQLVQYVNGVRQAHALKGNLAPDTVEGLLERVQAKSDNSKSLQLAINCLIGRNEGAAFVAPCEISGEAEKQLLTLILGL